ncbi:hypothetical protein PC116_g34961, partial [Phytophthora cactorum]
MMANVQTFPPFESTIQASGFLLSALRVSAPRAPALPIKTHFPGSYLWDQFVLRKHAIEHIIGNVMNGLSFELEFSLVSTRPEIQHAVNTFVLLIQTDPNSNMVGGELWDKDTIYQGSKWLYVVDQVRSYLKFEGLGFITVEM